MTADPLNAPTAAVSPPRAGSPELRELIEAIEAGAAGRERERRNPFDAVDLIRRARLGAFRLPVQNGGAGASVRELIELAINLGAADPNTAQIVRNHFAFVEMWLRSVRLEGRERWLAEVADGAIFGMLGTELGPAALGSRQFSTTLAETVDGYVLNGVKYYSTGAMFSDWVAVTAAGESGTVETALVPTDREGILFEDDWDGMGQRLTGSGTTRLVNVHVGKADLMSAATQIGNQSTFFQLWLTAIIVGILRAIIKDAVTLLHGRGRTYVHASGDKPVNDPLLQHVVGQISSYEFAARSTVLAAADVMAELADPAIEGPQEDQARLQTALAAAKAKSVVDELAIRAGSMLFDVGGASATKQGANLDRHWRNIRTLASHNPAIYKTRAIGDYEINDTLPPPSGFF
jgi:alkylation response protein AidB-like acyl-CoA dehydrogenase